MTLETILRAQPRFITPLAGVLRDAIADTARELWPEFTSYRERRRLDRDEPRREFDPETGDRYDQHGHFLPRWRRDRG